MAHGGWHLQCLRSRAGEGLGRVGKISKDEWLVWGANSLLIWFWSLECFWSWHTFFLEVFWGFRTTLTVYSFRKRWRLKQWNIKYRTCGLEMLACRFKMIPFYEKIGRNSLLIRKVDRCSQPPWRRFWRNTKKDLSPRAPYGHQWNKGEAANSCHLWEGGREFFDTKSSNIGKVF